jgi:flagellar motor switch protein FliN/FliY
MADDPVTPPATSDAAPPADIAGNLAGNLVEGHAALDSVDADLASAQASIDELLKQANFEDPSAFAAAGSSLPTTAFEMPDFQQAIHDSPVSSIELLKDVDLDVKIELGRSRMLVEDVLKLVEGSVVELDKLAGDPVDVFVNDRLVARGEVLVLNDNFCVRVNEILAGVREEGS